MGRWSVTVRARCQESNPPRLPTAYPERKPIMRPFHPHTASHLKVLERFTSVSGLAIAGLALLPSSALADNITPFKLEFPPVYIQAGIEVDPDFGDHPFVGVPPVNWRTPATLNLSPGLG